MRAYIKLIYSLLILFTGLDPILAQNPEVVAEDFSTRQVHLDFHTSEHLENIGARFDKKEWQETLSKAKVNSINIFAKGHHGYSYYPTEVGTQHPNLDFDLLKAQIEASHEIGIKCPLYFTVGWSVLDARQHPEWVILDKNGKSSSAARTENLKDTDPYPHTIWDLLMPEGDYLEMILRQTEELCKNYEVDGFWYDIIPNNAINYNAYSMERMKKEGIDPEDDKAVEQHHVEKIIHFMKSCNAIIKKYRPEASIFYNWSTHMSNSNTFKYALYSYDTSFDLEDLPTTWEGYNAFPLRAKYFSNLGRPITGMSGKFHTSWGEFGGFKYPNALKYEAAAMISFGANVNFGDQLHPSGKIDKSTYEFIGKTYDYVEQIEEFGPGGKHVARTGLWMTFDMPTDQAASLLLLETQTNYVVANNLDDWSNLEVLVLPSTPNLESGETEKIQKYIDEGGKVIILGEGALKADRSGFALDVGGKYLGGGRYDVDYTLVNPELSKNLVNSPFLNYLPAIRIDPDEDARVMANVREPYFSRTKEHYTSHRNTPYRLENAGHPAIYQDGNVLVIAHPLDKMYKEFGAQIHRELFKNALHQMLTEPMVSTNLPSSGRVNLLHFPEKRQYVVHLLYATPIQRGIARVIDDLLPIYDVEVQLDLENTIIKAYQVPDDRELSLKVSEKFVKLVVSEITGHAVVVLEY